MSADDRGPRFAPGWPGIPARWTTSAKTAIGTALSEESPVWFTTSHGILDEIYYPRVDQACVRDVGIIVTDGDRFFSEEKRHAIAERDRPGAVPLCRTTSRCREGRYRIRKEIFTDPWRPVVLQRLAFEALVGAEADYRVHVLVAPHLGNRGAGNTAWVGEHEGTPVLFAERDGVALACVASTPWRRASVGFVGTSDGWQDLRAHGRITFDYDRAENGNVAMVAELALVDGAVDLALGLGADPSEAARNAIQSLRAGYEAARERYEDQWRGWLAGLDPLVDAPEAAVSAAVLRTCESKQSPGGVVASLSIPWGDHQGDDDLGGYHLIWPRDLVEAAGGFLAVGAHEDAVRVLELLRSTQQDDGHWPQNMWLDGTPYWSGVQLDETALPILLADLLRRAGHLGDTARHWPMIRRAAGFLVRTGPVTAEDRWEEDAGYSPFTLAATIAALLAAADFADLQRDPVAARYLRDTADLWNASIERWTYVTDTPLARRLGIHGYYVRIAPPDRSAADGYIPIKNRPPGDSLEPALEIVSPDALALVRFGLRGADDPRIRDTVVAIDALLEEALPCGPAWRRYNHDGYGEHADGAPFDGVGIGRAWPLLTGERAHHELAAGRLGEARRLLAALECFGGATGLLPEQVWDADDVPARELFRGRPSGSAMPLVWAHAEHLKLLRSLRDGAVFDQPPQTVARYVEGTPSLDVVGWRFNQRPRVLGPGRTLRLDVGAPAVVRWTADAWATTAEASTRDGGLGMHWVELPTAALDEGTTVAFTFYWPHAGRWEGRDFEVVV
ncbi:MAG: glucan 1,4-alpha-glucosidase [Myxococcales bacterium]|nr:glucan 1,4-alpha-glucosidase [Myxococcales bacterium]